MGIKHRPQDFQVDEVLSADAGVGERRAAVAVYRVSKSGLDTPTVARMLAAVLGVRPDAVQVGGLKDKHATTSQHLGVEWSTSNPKPAPAKAAGDRWGAELVGYCDKPITSAAIAGNRFRIVVRGLTKRRAAEMADALTHLVVASGTARVVNYFGAQRFGSARAGEGFPAKRLVLGDFEGALKLILATPDRADDRRLKEFHQLAAKRWGDWKTLAHKLPRHPMRTAIEQLAKRPDDFQSAFAALPYFIQQINVEAYQSHLWNHTAVELVRRMCPAEDVFITKDRYGEAAFAAARAIPAGLATLDLPLLSPRTKLVEPWGDAARDVLASEGVEQSKLRVGTLRRPFFGESPRKLFIDATEFSLGEIEHDELGPREGNERRCKRVLTFVLPRGAYATVALRALGL